MTSTGGSKNEQRRGSRYGHLNTFYSFEDIEINRESEVIDFMRTIEKRTDAEVKNQSGLQAKNVSRDTEIIGNLLEQTHNCVT